MNIPRIAPALQQSLYCNRPCLFIPAEDMDWALEQRAPVHKLWIECWLSAPLRSRWMPLNTSLKKDNLRKAKKPLVDAGLFLFENRLTVVDGKQVYTWWIKNLHGSRPISINKSNFEMEVE